MIRDVYSGFRIPELLKKEMDPGSGSATMITYHAKYGTLGAQFSKYCTLYGIYISRPI
jgi:hypothetical protein